MGTPLLFVSRREYFRVNKRGLVDEKCVVCAKRRAFTILIFRGQ